MKAASLVDIEQPWQSNVKFGQCNKQRQPRWDFPTPSDPKPFSFDVEGHCIFTKKRPTCNERILFSSEEKHPARLTQTSTNPSRATYLFGVSNVMKFPTNLAITSEWNNQPSFWLVRQWRLYARRNNFTLNDCAMQCRLRTKKKNKNNKKPTKIG